MGLIFRMAWRNIWRHPRRVGLTLAAIVFSDIILVWMIGLQLGQYDLMINNTLNAFTGQVQIQHERFKDKPSLRYTVKNAAETAEKIRQLLNIEGVTTRAMSFALVSSEKRSYGAQIIGVEPEYESIVSTLPDFLVKGEYLKKTDKGVAVIGSVLARNLQLKVGDDITFLGSSKDGSIAAGVFKVKGLITSNMPDLDRHMIQIPLHTFQETFSLPDEVHTIVINTRHADRTAAIVEKLSPSLATISTQSNIRLLDWHALEPGLKQAIDADFASAWFMYSVLVLIVVFSVLNTFLMSVLERTHEFGVMLSLGLTPYRIGVWVMWESTLLAIVGLLLGIVLGYLFTLYFNIYGFTYPGLEGMAQQFNLSTTLYPQLTFTSVTLGPIIICASTLIAAIYPAFRIRLLRPVEALNAI